MQSQVRQPLHRRRRHRPRQLLTPTPTVSRCRSRRMTNRWTSLETLSGEGRRCPRKTRRIWALAVPQALR